jgi:WD40 repeat protein
MDNRILLYSVKREDLKSLAAALGGPTPPHAILSGHLARLTRMFFTLGGDMLVSSADDVSTRFWDVQRGVERFAPALNTTVIGVDGDRIVLVDNESQMSMWRLTSTGICRTLLAQSGVPAFIDDRLLAIGGEPGLSIWDLQAGVELSRLSKTRVNGVRVLRQGLLTAGVDALKLWSSDASTAGQFSGPAQLRSGLLVDLCVSPDQDIAFVTNDDRVLRIPMADPGSETVFAEQLGARPKSVSPDGKRLVVGNWAGTEVVVYSVQDGSRLFTLPTKGSHYSIGAFTPTRTDGGALLVVATNDRYHFLDAATYVERHSIPRRGWLVSLGISPDGEMAVITRSGSEPALIDLRSFKTIADLTLPEPNSTLKYSVFDPTSTTLVMTTNTSQIFVWDLTAMRQQLRQLGLDWP